MNQPKTIHNEAKVIDFMRYLNQKERTESDDTWRIVQCSDSFFDDRQEILKQRELAIGDGSDNRLNLLGLAHRRDGTLAGVESIGFNRTAKPSFEISHGHYSRRPVPHFKESIYCDPPDRILGSAFELFDCQGQLKNRYALDYDEAILQNVVIGSYEAEGGQWSERSVPCEQPFGDVVISHWISPETGCLEELVAQHDICSGRLLRICNEHRDADNELECRQVFHFDPVGLNVQAFESWRRTPEGSLQEVIIYDEYTRWPSRKYRILCHSDGRRRQISSFEYEDGETIRQAAHFFYSPDGRAVCRSLHHSFDLASGQLKESLGQHFDADGGLVRRVVGKLEGQHLLQWRLYYDGESREPKRAYKVDWDMASGQVVFEPLSPPLPEFCYNEKQS